MAGAIDPTEPLDGMPAPEAALRANLATAKSEIEALQAAQVPTGAVLGQVLEKTASTDWPTT